jgi:HK97 gp10 family phage protein
MAVKVKGLAKVSAQLKAVAPNVHAAMARELIVQVDSLVAYQQQLAPVATVHGTELRESIRREPGEDALQQRDVAGSRKAYYARFVEFGTAPSAKHAHTPRQPFFYPAYRARKKKIRLALGRAARKAIKAAARK